MHEARVASRYAKSLLELAQERGALDAVEKDMRLFVAVCEENKQFERILKNPVVKHDKKQALLEAIFRGKVNDLTLAMFEIITRKNREAFLNFIAKEFIQQYRTYKGIESAEVITTFPLNEGLKNEFIKLISASFDGKKVELKETVKPEILGGYILRVGDKQVDESIKAKLQTLKNKFKDNSYISKY